MRGVGNEAVKIDAGATRTRRDRSLPMEQYGDAFVLINKTDSIKRPSHFGLNKCLKKTKQMLSENVVVNRTAVSCYFC